MMMENITQPQTRDAKSEALNEYEELTWLRHQQCEQGIHQYAIAIKLSHHIDRSKLLTAIERACAHYPELKTLYQFDDELGLIKAFAPTVSNIISLDSVSFEQQAIERLRQCQAAAIDLHHQPGLQFHVYLLNQGEVILGAVVHPILQQQMCWRDVFSAISRAYQQQPFDASIRASHLQPELMNLDRVKCHVPGLERAALDVTTKHSPSEPTVANTFSACLDIEQLTKLSGDELAKRNVLNGVAALFAKQISQVTDRPMVKVSLPRELDDRFFELGATMIESNLVCVELDCSRDDPAYIVAQIESQMQQTAQLSSETTMPHVLVSWLADPVTFLRFDGVSVDRVALPTTDCRFELSLAMGVNCRQEGVIELTTAPNLSAYAGGWMLESLLKALDGQPHNELQLRSLTVPTDAISPIDILSQEVTQNPATSEQQPEKDIAQLIVNEFRDALGKPEMSVDDDFFDMGGHSLIATRVIGRLLKQHQVEIHINDLFSYSSAAALAQKATVHQTEVTTPHLDEQTRSDDDAFPLSLAQNSLWKAKQKYAEFGLHHIFNIPFALHFIDPVDEQVFGQAFNDLLIRHPGLRTQFFEQNGEPLQRVVPVAELDEYQWFWTSDETPSEPHAAALKQESGHGFDLANELPLRLKFIRDAQSKQQYLSLLFHHIVLDEWSVNILMDELNQAYQARIQGREPEWSFEPLPFHQYAQKQHASGMNQQHQAFWKQHLHDATWSSPIFDHNHPLSVVYEEDDNQGGWVEFKIEPQVSEQLYQLAKCRSASLFNVMYAGIITALRLLGAPQNLVVGTPASGRLDAEFFDTVGYFTTMVVHMNRVEESLSVVDIIEQVKQTINGSMPYTDIPIDLIEEALLAPGEERENHIFEVFIQLHAKNKLNGYLAGASGETIEFQQVDPDKSEGGLGLQFEVMEEMISGEPRVRVLMSYLAKHYSPAQVELLSNTTSDVLTRFATLGDGDLSLSALRTELKTTNPYIV
ncbi:condensation domain-containing protein [Vibrio sp. AK197]